MVTRFQFSSLVTATRLIGTSFAHSKTQALILSKLRCPNSQLHCVKTLVIENTFWIHPQIRKTDQVVSLFWHYSLQSLKTEMSSLAPLPSVSYVLKGVPLLPTGALHESRVFQGLNMHLCKFWPVDSSSFIPAPRIPHTIQWTCLEISLCV